MKIRLEKIILINRAPFDKIELELEENEIAVLSAVNGSGKTTILSHIVDAFYEMARPHFANEFEDKSNKYYRVSSPLYNLDVNRPSFVYLRFITSDGNIDYVDIRNKCTEQEYNEAIRIDSKIPFSDLQRMLEQLNGIKQVSKIFNKQKAESVFYNNILTYFPSYRYEQPGYLNEPYKIDIEFSKLSGFSGYLNNPLEVISDLPKLANWILDVVLDMRSGQLNQETVIFSNLNNIISKTLISKNIRNLRFGIGPRGFGSTRIQIMDAQTNTAIYPTIFNLSSGESSILCLFGELLRQADKNRNNIQLNQIEGIVLIDEVDKHLHIKLQKEVLPILFGLFPNIQFIISSHSPFLSMGLAENVKKRTKIVDLDNLGISKDPTTNELYTEVYNMMIGENERFKQMFQTLEQIVKNGTTPLIITEGKTDYHHIRKAKEVLNVQDCDLDYYEIVGDWGDSKLKLLLEQLSKVKQTRKVIGIFDRDVSDIVRDIEKNNQLFKDYTNNVYAFCIPVPNGREVYSNVSIEFYYSDNEIKKVKDGKRLYFDNEVDYLYNKSLNKHVISKLDTPRTEAEASKKIFDETKMCELADWIHSKANFARLVETDSVFVENFDFNNFNLIFERIKLIVAGNQ
jgi:predicted ATP-binding protein involved in virulence